MAPSSPPKFGGPKTSKFRRDFAQLRDLIANISGKQQDIVNRKTALQTTDTLAQASLFRCTLVHKRRKIGPEFWPTHRTGIRLGITTHLVRSFWLFKVYCWFPFATVTSVLQFNWMFPMCYTCNTSAIATSAIEAPYLLTYLLCILSVSCFHAL